MAVLRTDCPCSYDYDFGCDALHKCSYSMNINDLCEADGKLPDGNPIYEVDNCRTSNGLYDVFKYNGGLLFIFVDCK